jgi:hypothetical protein
MKLIPDYCTLVPDAVLSYDLSVCCKIHDELYESQHVSRKAADTIFYE